MNAAYATARDFASPLPLTLQMNDLLRREKYGRLPRSLTAGGEPQSSYEEYDGTLDVTIEAAD
ncbi:cyclophilin-like fold protein [Streptomyces pseudovenezuelae]|uniref:cyclophilin-like fold protein n=1 Tax=Streptomyces pseudovenezuelae TaxID=67350 RepID=UPI003714C320